MALFYDEALQGKSWTQLSWRRELGIPEQSTRPAAVKDSPVLCCKSPGGTICASRVPSSFLLRELCRGACERQAVEVDCW